MTNNELETKVEELEKHVENLYEIYSRQLAINQRIIDILSEIKTKNALEKAIESLSSRQ